MFAQHVSRIIHRFGDSVRAQQHHVAHIELDRELLIVNRFQNAQRQVGETFQVVSSSRSLERRAGAGTLQIEIVPLSASRRIPQRPPMPCIADDQMPCGAKYVSKSAVAKGPDFGRRRKFPIESRRQNEFDRAY